MHCIVVEHVTVHTYVIVSFKKLIITRETSVVVCIDLSGKDLYRQVGVIRVVTSGSLGGVIVCTLAWNARDMGSISVQGTIFPVFITPATVFI